MYQRNENVPPHPAVPNRFRGGQQLQPPVQSPKRREGSTGHKESPGCHGLGRSARFQSVSLILAPDAWDLEGAPWRGRDLASPPCVPGASWPALSFQLVVTFPGLSTPLSLGCSVIGAVMGPPPVKPWNGWRPAPAWGEQFGGFLASSSATEFRGLTRQH